MDPEEIKKQKMLELQKRYEEEQNLQQIQQQQQMQYELQKQKILRQILSEEARSRLARIKLAKPEFAEQVEVQLIQLAQMGRLPIPVSDAQLKMLLDKIYEANKPKKEIKIMRK
ncbi:MAG: programmed cell death protein 5 [Methanothermococcus sp.]|jgi:programmed cell death protein 5|uniref:DNA-binding protein n=1 Tax=Methanothermococcus TaxID=155862 RepID=UPI0003770DFD|nr:MULTISPECIES: DNA-binding protein [Methanothermococcus]MDK2790358.1 programmed cell death protein 5 [Methanothermococcus sp.]MDK2988278.1 programmed cell death protein 5 [Methanothermococcus sp.]